MRCARSGPSRSRTCRSRRAGFCRRWDGSANPCGFDLWQSVRSASKPSRQSNERTRQMNIKVGKQAIAEATEKLKNWGRWGKDDQIGTLNHVTSEDIVKAARLIRTGKVFALGIPLDSNGPQTGLFGGRFNPIHQMLATGTDAIAGRQDWNTLPLPDAPPVVGASGAGDCHARL